MSLFFDLLIAMSSKISKESFITGKCGKLYNLRVGINQDSSEESTSARSLVWNELSKYNMSPSKYSAQSNKTLLDCFIYFEFALHALNLIVV